MDRIGFIGVGLMGGPMALRLMDGGFPMTVWNRTEEKARPALDAGAAWAVSPRAVAEASDVVITMVTDSAASEEVACGPNGILEGAHPGLVLIDMSSITPDTSRAIAERAAAVGVGMLDAPVMGSLGAARDGQLGLMVGGPQEVFDRCQPILNQMAMQVVYAGQNGNGCVVKLLCNLILGIAVEAVSEALVLGAKLGIDPALVQKATMVGGGRTAAMEVRGTRMMERDFAPRFSVNNQHKDLTNAVALAQQAQVPLPLGVAAREMYQAARANGKGDLDSAIVVTILEAMANTIVKTSQS